MDSTGKPWKRNENEIVSFYFSKILDTHGARKMFGISKLFHIREIDGVVGFASQDFEP